MRRYGHVPALCLGFSALAISVVPCAGQQVPYQRKDSTVRTVAAVLLSAPPAGVSSPEQLREDVWTEKNASAFLGKFLKASQPTNRADCEKVTGVIFHVESWKYLDGSGGQPLIGTNDYSLDPESVWVGYATHWQKAGDECTWTRKIFQSTRSDNSPSFRGNGPILFVGIDYFDHIDQGGVGVAYKFSTTAQVAQNVQDLSTALTTLFGISQNTTPATTSQGKSGRALVAICSAPSIYATIVYIKPTAVAPYTLSIAPVVTPPASQFGLATAYLGKNYAIDLSEITQVYAGSKAIVRGISCPMTPVNGKANQFTFSMGQPEPVDLGSHPCTITVETGSTCNAVFHSSVTVSIAASDSNLQSDGNSPGAVPASQGGGHGAGGYQGSNQAGGQGGSQGSSQSNQSSAGLTPSEPVDCGDTSNSNPCTFTRTFTVDDKEWWDISLGVAIPGVVEPTYPSNPQLDAPLATAPTPLSNPRPTTTHTDAYALIDFYPFTRWWPNDDYVPHINGGIPITSQPLHRPYVGMGLPLTKPLERKGLPIQIDVFAGFVWMKQTIYDPMPHDPTGAPPEYGEYKTDHAWRPVWGVEVPISAIASKLTSSSKSSGGK